MIVTATLKGETIVHSNEDDSVLQVALCTCDICGSPMVVTRWGDLSDDYQSVEKWQALMRVWPSPRRDYADEIPWLVQSDLHEAHDCMTVDAYQAASILARRALEQMAKDHGATGRTLVTKLTHLKDSGVIDPRLHDWAEALRVIGNDAAHANSTRVTKVDAEDALAFVEALADYLYTFRTRYERFVKRRGTALNGT